MYESLYKHSEKFHIYIFAFDHESEVVLKKLNMEHVTVVSLTEFENEELLKVKNDRTIAEYCWTCTPAIIKYAIETYNLKNCTYLDADLYFFSDPAVLIDEMGSNSVLITEHRYSPEYDQGAKTGIYCVQFVTFINDTNGMNVLSWWRDACIEWCYDRFEDGKFGDQKYLDDWTQRFDGVHVLQNLGGGVAPWNIQQYNLADKDFKLIFYHFHGLKILSRNRIDLSGHKINMQVISKCYKPYVKHLLKIAEILKKNYNFDCSVFEQKKNISWKDPYRIFKRLINKTYHIYKQKCFIGD